MKKIKLLLAAIAAMVSLGVNATDWTGSELAAGKYYLYNVGAGQFLGYGGSWGTQAVIDATGIPVTLESSGSAYKIKTEVTGTSGKIYLGADFYIDQNACDYTFTAVDGLTNVYTISYSDGGVTKYRMIANNAKTFDKVSSVAAGGNWSLESLYWMLISADERNQKLTNKDATTESPLDLTYKIANPNTAFYTGCYSSENPWTAGVDGAGWANGGRDNGNAWRDKCFEVWNKNFNNYMTFSDMPKGKYQFSVTGFYRDGQFASGNNVQNVKIYANSEEVLLQPVLNGSSASQLCSVYADGDAWMNDATIEISGNTVYYPNSQPGACFYFANNKYSAQTVEVELQSAGTLTIGLKKETTVSGDWCVIDKFKLFYLGDPDNPAPYKAERDALIASLTALEGTIPTACYNAINAVAADNDDTYETIAEYQTAIDNINTAVSTYASSAIVANYTTYNTIKTAVLALDDDGTVFTGDATVSTTTADTEVEAATTADGINAAIVTLRANAATFLDNVKNNVNDGKYFDVTSVFLNNADISEGGQLQMPPGWETNYVSGQQANNIGCQHNTDYTNGNVTLHYFIEAWRNGARLGDGYLRQTVSNLPEGTYVLEADAISSWQADAAVVPTGVQLYITADGIDYTTDLHTGNGQPEHFSTQFLNSDAGGDIIFGLRTVSATANWIAADNFKVKFYGLDLSAYEAQLATEVSIFEGYESNVPVSLGTQVDALNTTYTSSSAYVAAIANMQTINAYAAAYVAATAARDNAANENVVGTEKTTLTGAIADAPTYADYSTYAAKTSALTYATSAFTSAATNYDNLVAEVAKAKVLGMADEDVDKYAATSSTSAATALTNTQKLKVDEYNFVATNYTSEVAIDPANWAASGDYGIMTSQHWSGSATEPYYEQSSAAWGNSSWSLTYTTTTSLPAGNYMFKVAGRRSSSAVNMTLTVNDGINNYIVNDFPIGDIGYGINTSGETSYDPEDSYNHKAADPENSGTGWEWRYVKFTLANPANVTLTVTGTTSSRYQWMGFCNASLLTDDAENVTLIESLVALTEAKNAATLVERTNKGIGVFQFDKTTDDGLWSVYSTAKSNADAFTLTNESTSTAVDALTSALTTAQTNYTNNSVLVQPDAEKRYTLTIVQDGKDWNGNAITFIAGGRNDMGGYGIKYLTPANSNMNQALKFTAVDGETNTYKVSAINVADGGERYITTGSTYDGGNSAQIRTTDDASKASWVKISAIGNISGQFQLLNVSDGNNVIAYSDNNDMYTENSCNFTIAEASQASVSVNIGADVKYSTRIFPFTPVLPDGVKAYTCEINANGTTIDLTEAVSPAANTPYILLAESGYTGDALTGWGIAGATSYEVAPLTGTFTQIAAPNGCYILQKQEDKVGFFLVDTSVATPNVPANRAYLTVPSGGDVKAFILGGDTDAINGVFSKVAAGEIYDLSGRKVAKMQKGNVYIINGVKVAVK